MKNTVVKLGFTISIIVFAFLASPVFSETTGYYLIGGNSPKYPVFKKFEISNPAGTTQDSVKGIVYHITRHEKDSIPTIVISESETVNFGADNKNTGRWIFKFASDRTRL